MTWLIGKLGPKTLQSYRFIRRKTSEKSRHVSLDNKPWVSSKHTTPTHKRWSPSCVIVIELVTKATSNFDSTRQTSAREKNHVWVFL
jgi:hypothetical protein